MTMHFGFAGFDGEGPTPSAPVDAVVHFAAVPRVLINPDNETFRVNVMGTYNVIEAAMKLGIRKVIDRVERDDLRRLLRGGRQGLPRSSRSRKTTTSIRWTATACPRS